MKKNNLLEQFDLAVEQVISSDSTEDIVKGIENEESSVSKGLEIRFKILELNHLTQDQDMRIKYGKCIFWFISIYTLAVIVLVYLKTFIYSANISDSVLITLLSTTIANVFGLFIIVLNYLFHKKTE